MAEAAPRSMASALADAMREQILLRREVLDRSTDLAEVTVTVKLSAGTTWVRSVVWSELRTKRKGS